MRESGCPPSGVFETWDYAQKTKSGVPHVSRFSKRGIPQLHAPWDFDFDLPSMASSLARLHTLSYYEAMPMTSLNISLPEALKEYVEGQVASGDWGTPSEYFLELIRQDKERRLVDLEASLAAAARGPKIELSVAEIRRKGLVRALR